MSDQPQYPQYPGDDHESGEGSGSYPTQPPPGGPAAAPEPPPSILNAVKLMYAGAGLAALSIVVGLFVSTGDDARDQIAEQLEQSGTEVTTEQIDAFYTAGIAFSVVVGLIAVVLWLWMARKNRQGRSWARIVGTVLGGINILFTLISLLGSALPGVGGGGLNLLMSLLTLAVAVAALYFLWRPESSRYYEAVSQSRLQ